MIRLIITIAMLLWAIVTHAIPITHVHAETSNHYADGYLSLTGEVLNWNDFFITSDYQTMKGQSDYIRFTGLTEWEHDTSNYTFAQTGHVSISELINQGVVAITSNHKIVVEYVLDGDFNNIVLIGNLYIRYRPNYLETWTGIINNAMSHLYVGYRDVPSRAAILSQLRAYDVEDGDVTLSISETTSFEAQIAYDLLTRGIGEYTLNFCAEDDVNNQAFLTVVVHVLDNVAPVIEGPDNTITLLGMEETLAEILARVWTVSDDYDVAPLLEVVTDEYTPNMNQLNEGGYKVVLQASDQYDNKTMREIFIIVQDDVTPQISGLSFYSKGVHTTLTADEIQAQLIVSDTDLLTTLSLVFDGFTTRQHRPGNYKMHFRAVDRAGNRSLDFVVSIQVNDDHAPIFFVNHTEYHVNEGDIIDETQLIALSVQAQVLSDELLSYEIILDNYSSNFAKQGSYRFVVNGITDEGEQQYVLNVIVHKNEAPISWWDKLVSQFNDLITFSWLS